MNTVDEGRVALVYIAAADTPVRMALRKRTEGFAQDRDNGGLMVM